MVFEIRDPEKTYSGSRIQGSKRHRIPDPQHWKKRAHSQKVWKNTNELVMYRSICIGKTQFIFIYHCMFTIVIHGGHYVMA
jgi:hypothetical protein